MFIAALFIIARTWKQRRYPLADEWIRKLWYIYTMEYYSAIEKKKAGKGEVTPVQALKLCIISSSFNHLIRTDSNVLFLMAE